MTEKRISPQNAGCDLAQKEVMRLIREEFLPGITTRQVGRLVGVLTGEVVSAKTVGKLTRSLDRLVKAFHQTRRKDEWSYLFLDG
jgi:transposase-like protein